MFSFLFIQTKGELFPPSTVFSQRGSGQVPGRCGSDRSHLHSQAIGYSKRRDDNDDDDYYHYYDYYCHHYYYEYSDGC